MKKGKKYVEAAKLVDKMTQYEVEDAVSLVKKTAVAKFDETIEAHIRLGVDGRHADQQVRGAVVLPNGTGYITDLGMTGPVNSVLGIDPMQSIGKFMGDPPRRYESAKGPCMMEGCIFEIDPDTGRCTGAQAVRLK